MAEGSIVGNVDVVECVVRYFYNVDPQEQVEALLGTVSADYLADWLKHYQAGFQHWWGRMDDDNKQKYVELARARYWGEIELRRMSIIIAKNQETPRDS